MLRGMYLYFTISPDIYLILYVDVISDSVIFHVFSDSKMYKVTNKYLQCYRSLSGLMTSLTFLSP